MTPRTTTLADTLAHEVAFADTVTEGVTLLNLGPGNVSWGVDNTVTVGGATSNVVPRGTPGDGTQPVFVPQTHFQPPHNGRLFLVADSAPTKVEVLTQ